MAKRDKKSEKQILVGYKESVKVYREYNSISKKITTSRDVKIMKYEKNHEIAVPVKETKQNI